MNSFMSYYIATFMLLDILYTRCNLRYLALYHISEYGIIHPGKEVAAYMFLMPKAAGWVRELVHIHHICNTRMYYAIWSSTQDRGVHFFFLVLGSMSAIQCFVLQCCVLLCANMGILSHGTKLRTREFFSGLSYTHSIRVFFLPYSDLL